MNETSLQAAGTARLSDVAQQIRAASVAHWGEGRAVELIGRSPEMERLLDRISKVARYDEPVLVLGESGVGKELLAQSIYLLGPRTKHAFVPVNCPQYQEGNLTVSELFGHAKGSFTGAISDRQGCFQTADRGVIFLDEIGDLHMSAQVMLLRALATGEFQPLGSTKTSKVNARVVAATNRSLNQLAENREFRRDLLFRLRYFPLEVPPLRERDDDWRLLIEHFLADLHQRYGVEKHFSKESIDLLTGYPWPGNVRELQTVVTSAYGMSDGQSIQPHDFAGHLEQLTQGHDDNLDATQRNLKRGRSTFWELVQEPFLERDLNRREVRRLVANGLRESHGSYRRLLALWCMPDSQYQKFMDFLRHHRLKPPSLEESEE